MCASGKYKTRNNPVNASHLLDSTAFSKNTFSVSSPIQRDTNIVYNTNIKAEILANTKLHCTVQIS